MKTSAVNIVVDLKQVFSRRTSETLIAELSGMSGVTRVWASRSAPRLMLVDYDPSQIDSQRILGTGMRRGFDARLIGM